LSSAADGGAHPTARLSQYGATSSIGGSPKSTHRAVGLIELTGAIAMLGRAGGIAQLGQGQATTFAASGARANPPRHR
jgi:hypothetical protein